MKIMNEYQIIMFLFKILFISIILLYLFLMYFILKNVNNFIDFLLYEILGIRNKIDFIY